jgi:hypothetical protein
VAAGICLTPVCQQSGRVFSAVKGKTDERVDNKTTGEITEMEFRRLIKAATLTGTVALIMAAGARADTISEINYTTPATIRYTTNASGTQFLGGAQGILTLNSSGGEAATITFKPHTDSDTPCRPTSISGISFSPVRPAPRPPLRLSAHSRLT